MDVRCTKNGVILEECFMVILKRFMLMAAIFAVPQLAVIAQPAPVTPGLLTPPSALTVEQMYLQEAIEMMIIREQIRGGTREMQLVGLDFIGEALSRGSRGPELHATLEFLAFEGVINLTRENGRVINNFPDVRVRAANLLGQFGTPAAVQTLLVMVANDNEPMVLTEAIRSLGIIGADPNMEVINTIALTMNRFNNLNPDNLLALSAIEAIERISAANDGIVAPTAVQTLIRIAEGNYMTIIRNRARTALSDLRRGLHH